MVNGPQNQKVIITTPENGAAIKPYHNLLNQVNTSDSTLTGALVSPAQKGLQAFLRPKECIKEWIANLYPLDPMTIKWEVTEIQDSKIEEDITMVQICYSTRPVLSVGGGEITQLRKKLGS